MPLILCLVLCFDSAKLDSATTGIEVGGLAHYLLLWTTGWNAWIHFELTFVLPGFLHNQGVYFKFDDGSHLTCPIL